MLKVFYPLLLSAATCGMTAMAQETRTRVVDAVNLPAAESGQPDRSWYLVFNESWMIAAHRPYILKTVNSYTVHDYRNPEADADSLQAALGKYASGIPLNRGAARLGEVSYEFLLMDPDTEQTNNLHTPLSSLVSAHSAAAQHYVLKDQLLSVYFHETWSIDPDSLRITKKVLGVTPVIWQRRQTTHGEPVNDAESGLPVYYKLQLERIPLRNP
jgi:hypothetical protein